MEDYKKIAIELGKTLISKAPETREDVEKMLPELKESEDKRIRKAIKSVISYNVGGKIYGFTKEEMIAWLEKQGEQKPQRMVSAEAKEAMYGKPAWSEEDDRMLDKCIKAACSNYYPGISSVREWLRGIKDRVLSKQWWSEEDEWNRNEIIANLNEFIEIYKRDDIKPLIDWLKSLRPQNRWKPSELQIEALESATENCAYSEYQDCLRELIGQLKKLNEE